MKSKFFAVLILATLMFVGCSEDSVTNPDEGGSNNNNGTITLSGAESGSYNATVGILNSGDEVAITVSDNDANISLILTSKNVKTGTFSVPDQYAIVCTNEGDTTMTQMHTGTVKIDEIGSTSVKGSLTASGYPMKLTTFMVDSSKVVTVNATFSL